MQNYKLRIVKVFNRTNLEVPHQICCKNSFLYLITVDKLKSLSQSENNWKYRQHILSLAENYSPCNLHNYSIYNNNYDFA